ncbi:hypothetical protein [Massilia cavernae]|uniref:hypothetical protein n=1 Tax=Massilia cavernae TaxID=2320864 RepID=UPI0011C41F20|nr:hypothetical protein [Massilia cavernae]
MNVALPALIVFLVLLPGFIFRSGLKRAERTSIDFSPFGRIVAEAVLWAIFAHAVWLAFSYIFFQNLLEAVVLLNLLSSHPASQATATQQVGVGFPWISGYFVSLIVASYVAPSGMRRDIASQAGP